MQIAGRRFAIVGALDALTRRLARREITSSGGVLRHGLSDRIDYAVFGHAMVRSWPLRKIEARLSRLDAGRVRAISENSLLRMVGLGQPPDFARSFASADLLQQSNLSGEAFRRLVLFDAFDFGEEPFGMRDMVAARQYAKLLAEGVEWPILIRAIRARGRLPDGSVAVSDVRLERSGYNHVVMRVGGTLTELDGQHMLPLACGQHPDQLDQLLERAEDAELSGDWQEAAELHRRALALDPDNPLIPFNLGCALIKLERWDEATHQFHRTLKLDRGYAEAWYNLGSIALRRTDCAAARRYLQRAIAADPEYSDPAYNLALIEFEAGAYAEAARLWSRYLELDPHTAWSRKARQGLHLIRLLAKGEMEEGPAWPPLADPQPSG